MCEMPSPSTRTVTDRFRRVTGTIIKGFLGGVLFTDNGGSAPSPEGQIPPLSGEMSRSDKGGAGPAGPHGTLQPEGMKVP